jgi:hypothetical protein
MPGRQWTADLEVKRLMEVLGGAMAPGAVEDTQEGLEEAADSAGGGGEGTAKKKKKKTGKKKK